MRTIFRTFLLIFFLLLFSTNAGRVYGAAEEIEGKAIWEKLSRSQDRGSSTESGQSKQIECKDLAVNDFELLGEYFMGQTVGDSHESMNNMMEQMMGKEGEEQMHIVMGKRLSGCESNAVMATPLRQGFEGQEGGGNSMMGQDWNNWNNMMAGRGGFGLGWLFMLLFWALLILGVVALIRYLTRSGDNKQGKTPLDILKERYAGGEIDKKEFEEKKEDLLTKTK
ncbi:SHOCT domain-containing protein [Candidatus Collierbacteria bacterium]|nr:SHOCT domain-containing protein [Candidatus Collierbacteria bacterium]